MKNDRFVQVERNYNVNLIRAVSVTELNLVKLIGPFILQLKSFRFTLE